MQGTIERGVYGTATAILPVVSSQGHPETVVVYQDTGVVRWSPRRIILTAPAPARTQTTKLRMNQASYQFELGYIVVQKQGKWYVYESTLSESGKLKSTGRKLCDFALTKAQVTLFRAENRITAGV